jgi:hypothetical protein
MLGFAFIVFGMLFVSALIHETIEIYPPGTPAYKIPLKTNILALIGFAILGYGIFISVEPYFHWDIEYYLFSTAITVWLFSILVYPKLLSFRFMRSFHRLSTQYLPDLYNKGKTNVAEVTENEANDSIKPLIDDMLDIVDPLSEARKQTDYERRYSPNFDEWERELERKEDSIRKNPVLHEGFKLQNKLRDYLIKRLFTHRCMNSPQSQFIEIRDMVMNEYVSEKRTTLKECVDAFVEIQFTLMTENEKWSLPEATIALMSEQYHQIKRSHKSAPESDYGVFEELDINRESNHLNTFGSQELTLENFIIHVFNEENSDQLHKIEPWNLVRKQIKIATEFAHDYELRKKIISSD